MDALARPCEWTATPHVCYGNSIALTQLQLDGLRRSLAKFHLKKIFEKLDVSSRTQAVSVAIEKKLLGD